VTRAMDDIVIRPKKILVADDEPMLRAMLKEALEASGYLVTVVGDGKSVLEKVASEKFDLVLMDGLLPGMHGFLACKAIKELPSPPKVILFTGVYTKPKYRIEATQKYGADEMLTKPIDLDELLRRIARHLLGLPVLPAPGRSGTAQSVKKDGRR
jgi:DNA-binding response OmpR family regulator